MTDMTQSLAKIGNALQRNEKRITAKLGGMIKWEYFCSAFLTSVEKNPALADCTEASLIKAVLDASQLRLIPDGVLGEAYIVPYGKTATLIPGYKGLIQLCLRSGLVKKIGARIVYKNDLFKYEYGMNEACVHIPTEEEPGEIRGSYATFEMADGVKGFEFWPYKKLEIHAIRYVPGIDRKDRKGNYTSLWHTNREAWMYKTVLRSVTKALPKSIEDITVANAIEDGIDLDLAATEFKEINNEKKAETAKILDDQKPNLELLKDELSDAKPPAMGEMVAVPPDFDGDLPMGCAPTGKTEEPKLITEDQGTAFRDKVQELSLPTKRLIKYLDDNGFSDISVITQEKYDGMIAGLNLISK